MENPSSPPSQTIGSLTQDIVKNASSSVMTSPTLPNNSETMPTPKPQNTQAGTQLSTTGSGTLRDLAVAAVEGRTGILTDHHLKTSLESHFGSRLDVQSKINYGTEDKPTFTISGWQVTICRDETDGKVQTWMEAMNRPAKQEFIAGKLARMRVMLARRGESDRDVTILIDTMMELCGGYPADAIADVTDHWLRTQKFFPKASELIELLEEKVMLRRAVLEALAPKALRIGRTEKPKSYKEVPKDKWDMTMWRAYVADAEGMHALALENPTVMDATGWAAEVATRKAAIPAGLLGSGTAPVVDARGTA